MEAAIAFFGTLFVLFGFAFYAGWRPRHMFKNDDNRSQDGAKLDND